MAEADHRAYKGLNNRIEGSHRPTRRREKIMGCFKSARQAQRFLAAHDKITILFRPRRYKLTAKLLPPRQIRRRRSLADLCARNDRIRQTRPRSSQTVLGKLAMPGECLRKDPRKMRGLGPSCLRHHWLGSGPRCAAPWARIGAVSKAFQSSGKGWTCRGLMPHQVCSARFFQL